MASFFGARAEFDMTRRQVESEDVSDNLREFRSNYPLRPLRLRTLIAVQALGGQAFGDGVELLDGAPPSMASPLTTTIDSGEAFQGAVVASRRDGSENCEASEALLGFIDDYLSYAGGDGHLAGWTSRGNISSAYYGLHVWHGSLDGLAEVRAQIAPLIAEGSCLDLRPVSPDEVVPTASSAGTEVVDDGLIVMRSEHEILMGDSPLYRYRDAAVYRRGQNSRIVHYCCNASIDGPCAVPSYWSANAVAMRAEFEVAND
ncbi:hypothetical protein AWH62_07090 [Maricaulis sp. W15]|nr:hypothetical protein AWH62_07090 [Maricaulis sp. W15]